ncbi:hypothetical protein JTS99_16270 [Clostridium botulinum]|nr:hypothetical protein [Clostridium botulinum]MCS4515673.1 hypothetical protein [Clostridium botulinum]MCS4522268.1 hypothetical protein [Clostridium botulinum]
MNKEEIIDYLNDNDIYNIEEIEYNEDVFQLKFIMNLMRKRY